MRSKEGDRPTPVYHVRPKVSFQAVATANPTPESKTSSARVLRVGAWPSKKRTAGLRTRGKKPSVMSQSGKRSL